MNTIKRHAAKSLKWSAVAGGFGVSLIAVLALSAWLSFQVMVYLVQH